MKRETGVEGSVYQATFRAKDGTVRTCATWTARWYGDGRHNKRAGFPSKAAAQKHISTIRAEVAKGQFVAGVDRTTFEDIKDLLVSDYRTNRRKSTERMTGSVHHLDAFFRGLLVRNITAPKILQYVEMRQTEKAGNGTINRELAALKRMFRLGARSNLVARLPYIGMLDEPAPRSGFFEREQFESLRAHLPEHLRAVVTVAYHTGWRIKSEILTRQWKHVDFANGWLILEPGEAKNKDPRVFPLYPELRAVLEEQRARADEIEKTGQIVPHVFHIDGKSFRSFRRAWITACRKAGVPGRIPHDFRRTAVRNLERSGVPRSSAMALVGHKTESIYRRYAVKNEADLREAGERLAALHAMEPSAAKSDSGLVRPQSIGAPVLRRVQPMRKVGGLGRD